MERPFTFQLDSADILQTLDALEGRAEAWEKTESSLNGDLEDIFFVAEECDSPFEASQIAKHFRDIVTKIESQLQEQQTLRS